MANNSSQYILNTSSNLLGFCLVVLTSLKVTKINETTYIDELTGIACILLVTSSFLSFLSLRSTKQKQIDIYERISDNFFIVGLVFVFLITFMIAFSMIF
jgi:hypothetical protein